MQYSRIGYDNTNFDFRAVCLDKNKKLSMTE